GGVLELLRRNRIAELNADGVLYGRLWFVGCSCGPARAGKSKQNNDIQIKTQSAKGHGILRQQRNRARCGVLWAVRLVIFSRPEHLRDYIRCLSTARSKHGECAEVEKS